MISILSIQFNNENPSYLGIEQSDLFRSKSKERNLMQYPYTIPMNTHKLFNATYMYFFSISFNVNEQKGKLMHDRLINSFHKNDDFVTIYFQGKEDFTTLSFSKK